MAVGKPETKLVIAYTGEDSDIFELKIAAIQGALSSGADFYLDPVTGEEMDMAPLKKELKLKSIRIVPRSSATPEET